MSVRAAQRATDGGGIAGGEARAAGRRRSAVWLALIAAAFVAESLVFVWLGRALIDEGVFLNASRLVSDGSVLYRDFPWSQGPTLPYLLAIISALFGASLLAGRALAWVGCLVSVAASAWIAGRFAGIWAAPLALLLAMTNLPMLWVSTSVRTQALSTPLVMLAAAALARTPKSALGWAAAPSLLLWATGIRLTDVLAFAVVALFTAWQLRGRPRLLAQVAAWVGAQAALVLLPVLRSPGDAWFHVVTSQLARGSRGGYDPMTWADKASFYLHPLYGFHLVFVLAIALALALVVSHARGRRGRMALPISEPVSAQLTLVALALLVFLPHLLLSHLYLTYAVSSSLLVGTAVAIALGAWARDAGRRRWAPILAIGVTVLALAANASERWSTFVGQGESGLGHLRAMGRTLRALGGDECTIATLQTHLAVESGCRLLPGLEYSLFSYFRELPDAEAEALGVLNQGLLDRRIAALRPELIAVSRHDGRALRARGQPPVGGHPLLDFIPSSAFDYAYYGVIQIASGMRLPETSDTLRVVVFVRKDLVGLGGELR